MALVSLHDVSVRYDDFTALERVSLDIFEDDFLGIIGPNGGGKTTLVKAIVGALPHSGNIELSPSLFRGKTRLIGYMPQRTSFDTSFPISVLELVMSGLQSERGFHSRYSTEDRRRALALLEMAGISELASRQIGEISGGQLQRALLCRAIIIEPNTTKGERSKSLSARLTPDCTCAVSPVMRVIKVDVPILSFSA